MQVLRKNDKRGKNGIQVLGSKTHDFRTEKQMLKKKQKDYGKVLCIN